MDGTTAARCWGISCVLALVHAGPAFARDVDAPEREGDAAPVAAEPVVTVPELLSDAHVDYPGAADGSAVVVLELTVGVEGDVESVSVVTGAPPFSETARAAAQKWRFSPAQRDGVPVSARIRFEVRFVPPEPSSEAPDVAPATSPREPDPTARPELPEIVVHGERGSGPSRQTRAEVRQLPGAFGDPFRAVESRPGVTPIGSGLPYFYVRGAPPGNVGYFLDGIFVPGLFHVAVGPSVIHPALIESVTLYRGPFPARYGRFTGGIVAGETTEPSDRLGGEASLRLVDAGAFLEAPFADGRGHAAVGGRYSYTAAVLSLVVPELHVAYWDYQARADYALSRSDRVGLFAFGSYDFLSQDEDGDPTTLFDVGFHRVDLRWDRFVDEGRVRVAGTAGRDESTIEEGDVTVENLSARLRVEYDQKLSSRAHLRAGTDVALDRYDATTPPPGQGTATVDRLSRQLTSRTDVTTGAYVDAEFRASRRVRLDPGLRVDVFTSGEHALVGVDPRLFARYFVTDEVTLVHGLGLAHQRPSFLIPVPGVQPVLDELQTTAHSSYGIEWSLPSDVSLSATVYQGVHFDLSDPLGISRLDNGDPNIGEETRMLGHTYGLELIVERSLTRRLGGYVSYTLARSTRAAGRVSGPSTFDRRHVLGTAVAYDLGRRWRIGGRGVFYTGTPADVAYVEAARDPPRTRPFWRLDWRLEKSWPIGAEGAFWAVVLEVLNTTLNEEQINASCSAYVCRGEEFGPVTLPSLGVEAKF